MKSIDTYLSRTQRDRNLKSITSAVSGDGSNGKSKAKPAAPAAPGGEGISAQCPWHLKPNGCKFADSCTKGRHDPQFKGKGETSAPKKGKKEPQKGESKAKSPKGSDPKKWSSKDKSKDGSGKKKLPKDAIKDEEGRFLCYNFVHGKCDGKGCSKYHGPATEAMTKKRLADEAKMKTKAAAVAKRKSESPSAEAEPKPPKSEKGKKGE